MPLTAEINVRVKEGSGRPVERSITRKIMPSQPVIGIDPLFEEGVVGEGQDAQFRLIAVAPDQTQTDMTVKWTLNRITYRYQWYSVRGNWDWERTTTRTRVAGGDLMLTADAPQEVSAPVDWGTYELVVERADGTYIASSTQFYAGWYVPADAASTPDTLELSLDKPTYRPGEQAQLRVVPRAAGVALITVISDRLIDTQTVEVTEGENLIPLAVTDEWGAGAYVTPRSCGHLRPRLGGPRPVRWVWPMRRLIRAKNGLRPRSTCRPNPTPGDPCPWR